MRRKAGNHDNFSSRNGAEDRRAIAAIHRVISIVHYNLGHAAEALRSAERARTIAERLVIERPDVAAFRHELAMAYTRLAWLQQAVGRPAEALMT